MAKKEKKPFAFRDELNGVTLNFVLSTVGAVLMLIGMPLNVMTVTATVLGYTESETCSLSALVSYSDYALLQLPIALMWLLAIVGAVGTVALVYLGYRFLSRFTELVLFLPLLYEFCVFAVYFASAMKTSGVSVTPGIGLILMLIGLILCDVGIRMSMKPLGSGKAA